jgi:hypothetical protein
MSIFDSNNKVTSQYWKYPNVGDKIEGTYIDRRVTVNKLKAGAEQIVYTLKTPSGEIWDVYGKPGIDAQMRNVNLGQIIGFEFIEQKPATQAGFSPTKIVQVYANSQIVDENWLKEMSAFPSDMSLDEGISSGENIATSVPSTAALLPTPAPVAPSATTSLEETIREINNLAISKLGATTPEDVKSKSMEATGLAFIEGNLSQILDALRALPAKV